MEGTKKTIVAVEFGFENGGSLRFATDAFEYAYIRDVRRAYFHPRRSNQPEEHCRANGGLEILIKKAANDIPKYRPTAYEKLTPFQRLKLFDDIVSLELIYDDGTSRVVYVPFEERNECESSLQSGYETEDGDFLLKIKACRKRQDAPDENEDEEHFLENPDDTEAAIAEIHQRIRDAVLQYESRVPLEKCDVAFAFIYGAITEANRHIKSAIPYNYSLEDKKAAYERIRESTLQMIGEWQGKSRPIFEKLQSAIEKEPGKSLLPEESFEGKAAHIIEGINRGFEQFLRLLDEEMLLARWRCGDVYDEDYDKNKMIWMTRDMRGEGEQIPMMVRILKNLQ